MRASGARKSVPPTGAGGNGPDRGPLALPGVDLRLRRGQAGGAAAVSGRVAGGERRPVVARQLSYEPHAVAGPGSPAGGVVRGRLLGERLLRRASPAGEQQGHGRAPPGRLGGVRPDADHHARTCGHGGTIQVLEAGALPGSFAKVWPETFLPLRAPAFLLSRTAVAVAVKRYIDKMGIDSVPLALLGTIFLVQVMAASLFARSHWRRYGLGGGSCHRG